MAELAAPKPCTWASRAPRLGMVARSRLRGAGPGVVTSTWVPPVKSMPRFSPCTANDAIEPRIRSADRAAAMGANRTKSNFVSWGR